MYIYSFKKYAVIYMILFLFYPVDNISTLGIYTSRVGGEVLNVRSFFSLGMFDLGNLWLIFFLDFIR